MERYGAGDPIVSIGGGDGKGMQLTITLGKIALGFDALTFALLVGADAEVDSNIHRVQLSLPGFRRWLENWC